MRIMGGSSHAHKMAASPNRSRNGVSCAEAMAAEGDASPPPAGRPPRPGSPENEHDFLQEPPQDFYCAVSIELLMEPHQTGCCGHHLSRSVVERLQREGRDCPMCKRPNFPTVTDRYMRRKVMELMVRCRYKRGGCDWTGELGNLEAHAQSCPKQPWVCPHCKFLSLREVAQNHTDHCDQVPVPCPNRCEAGHVPRCQLSNHIERTCPLQPVTCPFSHAGCTSRVARRDMDNHTHSMQQHHMLLTCSANLDLTRQMNEKMAQREAQMEAKMEGLRADVARLERELGERVQAVEGGIVAEMQDAVAKQFEVALREMGGVMVGEVVQEVKREIGALGEGVRVVEGQLKTTEAKISAEVGALDTKLVAVEKQVELVQKEQKEIGDKLATSNKKKRDKVQTSPTHVRKTSPTRVRQTSPTIVRLVSPTLTRRVSASLLEPAAKKGHKSRGAKVVDLPVAASLVAAPRGKTVNEEDANCKPAATGITHSQSLQTFPLEPVVVTPNYPPCDFKIRNFSKLKEQNKEWRSDPFYSKEGYKMCLGVWPNGFRSGTATHVSVEFYKMKDANTDKLPWNLKLPIHVRVFNYKTSKWEKDHVNGETFTRSKVSGEFETSGYAQSHKLVAHDDLKPYLHDDTFRIQVQKFECMS